MKKFMKAATITTALALALAACGGSGTTNEAASAPDDADAGAVSVPAPDTAYADRPGAADDTNGATSGTDDRSAPGSADPMPLSAEPQAAASPSSTSLCSALTGLVTTIDIWDGTNFDDTAGVRVGAESITANLMAAQAAADGQVRAELDRLVGLWTPWAELLRDAEYDFFAIDPVQAEFLFDPNYAAEFEASSDALLNHAIEDCGLDADLVRNASGTDETAATPEEQAVDALSVGVLSGPGVILEQDTGERFEMSDGFCGVDDATGLIVGSFTDGTREISFVADTTGDQPNVNTITIAGAGSASARMPMWTLADDHQAGSFTTRDMAGAFRCS